MEIEKCPDCNGSGFATVGMFRKFKRNGVFKAKYLKYFINEESKKLVAEYTADKNKCMLCKHCKGKGYLYDRLPYDGPLDIGFCNF